MFLSSLGVGLDLRHQLLVSLPGGGGAQPFFVPVSSHSLMPGGRSANLGGMLFTHADKVRAEHRFREFLREYDLPQPDEVEYGSTCLRFLYHETKACVIFDLDPDAEPDNDEPVRP